MEKTAVSIIRKLHNKGYEAMFAGGCVRDDLLGIKSKDYDIVTNATPDEVLEIFPYANKVGAHFGVILIKKNGHLFEVATFRKDGLYLDGRRPETVEFSDPQEDAKRRDFTINGMFYDPVNKKLIDYVNGKLDLKNKSIRAIGNPRERFNEDYLRMLRGIRFATSLNFKIEERTWSNIKESASLISKTSPERIREELDKILISPNRLLGFDLLIESGLMLHIIPEIIKLKSCEQLKKCYPEDDVFKHTRLLLSLLPKKSNIILILSTLLHDIGKANTYLYDNKKDRIRFNAHDIEDAKICREILRRLKYSNEIIDAVSSIIRNHMNFKDVKNMRVSKLKRFMAREYFDIEIILHKIDCLASKGNLDNYNFVLERQEEYSKINLIPEPFINGKDLIDRNLEPGPKFKKILTEAQDMQLEGKLKNREEAIAWLDKYIEK